MDDYGLAYKARAVDTYKLHKEGRTVGTMHLAGITIECILKEIIVKKYKITNWQTKYSSNKFSIDNPGHNFIRAISHIPELRKRLHNSKALTNHLNNLQSPGTDYIALRYVGKEMLGHDYIQYYQSYREVLKWLLKQKDTL